MIKAYKAYTAYSVTVRTEDGSRCHIRFVNDSYGHSYYRTSDKSIQDALEATGLLGDMFYLVEEIDDTPKVEAKEEEQQELTTVEVSDIEEAREYLNEHFGVAKRNMRSTASVKAIAEQNGITFVGI